MDWISFGLGVLAGVTLLAVLICCGVHTFWPDDEIKGGQNPPNDSDVRPPPPGGSGSIWFYDAEERSKRPEPPPAPPLPSTLMGFPVTYIDHTEEVVENPTS